jgi:hypothetical protein
MDSHQRRRAKLAREKAWCENYVHHLPELRPQDLIRGVKYHAVTYHAEECRLYLGGRCSCRPEVKFYAEPTRS